jgi:hypothetical protein
MTKYSLEEKKQQILDFEESFAGRLARLVMKKPVPPVWMILIPVFFVFYVMKLKEYSAGLKDFSNHYLHFRRHALDTAFTSVEHGREPDIDKLMTDTENIPAASRPLFREWITLLTDHYCNLLTAEGHNVQERIRHRYRDKSSYMLFNNRLTRAEVIFNNSLLPFIEGEQQDIRFVAERMQKSCTDLRREEVDMIFS